MFRKTNCFAFWSWKLFPSCFQWALTVFDVFDQFLVFVLFCRFWANFWWFKAFLLDFDQKSVFSKKRFWFSIWSQNSFLSGFQHFVAVFDVFTRVSFLVLFDRFGRLWARFEWLAVFWHTFVFSVFDLLTDFWFLCCLAVLLVFLQN